MESKVVSLQLAELFLESYNETNVKTRAFSSDVGSGAKCSTSIKETAMSCVTKATKEFSPRVLPNMDRLVNKTDITELLYGSSLDKSKDYKTFVHSIVCEPMACNVRVPQSTVQKHDEVLKDSHGDELGHSEASLKKAVSSTDLQTPYDTTPSVRHQKLMRAKSTESVIPASISFWNTDLQSCSGAENRFCTNSNFNKHGNVLSRLKLIGSDSDLTLASRESTPSIWGRRVIVQRPKAIRMSTPHLSTFTELEIEPPSRRSFNFISKPSEVARLTQSALSAIYHPFSAVKKTLVRQARDILLCRFFGDFQKFKEEFLTPAASLLGKLQARCQESRNRREQLHTQSKMDLDDLCHSCCELKWSSWPLCVHQRVLVQLGEIDRSLLKPGDFYFCLRQSWSSSYMPSSNNSCLEVVCIYRTLSGIKERVAHESELDILFAMDWIHHPLTPVSPAVLSKPDSEEHLPFLLQNLLVTVERGIERIEWQHVTKNWFCSHTFPSQLLYPADLSGCHGNQAIHMKDSSVQTSPKHYIDSNKRQDAVVCDHTDTDISEVGKYHGCYASSTLQANLQGHDYLLGRSDTGHYDTEYHSSSANEPPSLMSTSNGQARELGDGHNDSTLFHPASITEVSVELRDSEIAVLPGCRDVTGRSVIVVNLNTWQKHRDVTALQVAQLLMYFHTIPRKEVICRGFLVLVDVREVEDPDLTELDETLCLVGMNINNAINSLVIWMKEEECDRRYFLKSQVKYEVVRSWVKLHKFIKKEQLISQMGGSYVYDHKDWVTFRKCIEPFLSGCHFYGRHLVGVLQELRTSRLPSTASLTSQLLEQHRKVVGQTFQDERLRHLEEDGENILKKLDSFRSSTPHNVDYKEGLDRGTVLYNELRRAVKKLRRLAEKRQQKLETYLHLKTLEEESGQVLGWLCGKGVDTLTKHQAMADSLISLKEQEGEFEKFYFLAMRQIEKGNDLMEEASMFGATLSSADGFGKAQSLTSSLGEHIQYFAERLEDTRERLEDSARCYSLLDRSYEWAVEAMKFVSHLKTEKITHPKELMKLIKSLQDYVDNNPPIREEAFKEMLDLATKLENDSLFEQCKIAQARCQDTNDLIKARQATLLRAKQQMEVESLQCSDLPTGSRDSQCFWIPHSTSTPVGEHSGYYHRKPVANTSSSYNFHVGSYTSFPSNCLSVPATKDSFQLDHYMEEKEEQLHGQGLITDDLTTQGPVASISRSKLEARAGNSNQKETPPGGVMKSHSGSSLVGLKEKIAGLVAGAASVQNSAKEGHYYNRPIRKLMRRSHTWQLYEENSQKPNSDIQIPDNNLRLQQVVINSEESGVSGNISKLPVVESLPLPCGGPVPVNSHLTRTPSFRVRQECDMYIDQQAKTKKQLLLIMREMIHTERDYVKSLEYIIENYIPELLRDDIPQALRGQRSVIFGNIEKIYEFHNHYFLSELERCEDSPFLVGQCFQDYEAQFYLYALYNKNKPKSDSLMVEYGNAFFKKKQLELGDKMDLASYLLKPVQRMGKYALLLKQLLKECPEKISEYQNLKAAEEIVRFQLRHGNDLLAMDALRDCDVNVKEQGRLLRQDEFIVWQGRSRKSLRHVFLFEDLILFSKARRDPERKGHEIYQYKHSIKTSDIGMTEQTGDSPTKFEIWFRKRKLNDTYILQAPNSDVKAAWVQEVSKLLWRQALRNREMRLAEMSSMGIGNKPCLDIKPSEDQISDRLVAVQQSCRVPQFHSSVTVSPNDYLRSNKRPHSIISVSSSSSGSSLSSYTCYGALQLGLDPGDSHVFLQNLIEESHYSAESGIDTDVSMTGECSSDMCGLQHKKPERSNSILSNESLVTNPPSSVHLQSDKQFLEEPDETVTM
ncbi:uncharacterized protein LOC106462819 isoform X2 [Limulus polyphemus]|uniref:Uncharacterized protein LOC106462819 isoform X2 n=1 Tax=Limulus polyphemus TaxID=6850 RepID=A0ABM1BAQ3_LIMPO|nr:uncharacterized protein LOC106462819 isoform X2 [Limulus polyphemus]